MNKGINKQRIHNFDTSTNIIVSTKITNYTAYKAGRLPTFKHSYKKMEHLNIKIFDQKKNNKLYTKNQRTDLYLEGGKVSEPKKVSSKSLISNDETFYRVQKGKRKGDIILALDPKQKTNNWPISTIAYEHQQAKDIYSFKSKELNTRTDSRQMQRKSTQNINKISGLPKPDFQIKFNRRKYQSVKSQVRKVCDSESTNRQLPKKRPLFYLEPKEINHIKADSFIVTQYPSGEIIMGNYYKKAAEIASLTKIMTFYTVWELAISFEKDLGNEVIEIDEQAQQMTGTSAQVFMGDQYTVEQLLYGLMLPSGNDAATALAKWGGNILLEKEQTKSQTMQTPKNPVKRFVQEMNTIAKKLNLRSTKFGNPHGLPHAQSGSNPQDLSLLVHQCLKIDLFRTVVRTRHYSCWITDNEKVKREVIWENTNKLLRRPNFMGVKTGVTVTAGPCLATCYEVQDKIFIVILLRTNKLSRRFKETRWILGIALNKLDKHKYEQNIRRILKNDAELDSDNSEDEAEFNYDRSDAKQMKKRNKILTFQM